jgi:molybdenum cofactor cytidylyltransferase
VKSKTSINNIAGIIIAAGESKRLGRIKQLLPWRGKSLIEFIIQTARDCKLEPIQVILGANYDQIAPMINYPRVNIINNQRWKKGKGTSISLGINSLPESVKASFVFVVDQPFLNRKLINTLLNVYEIKKAEIVAPYIREIQSNPVLFDRSVFPELRKLKGDKGGRSIFNDYRFEKLAWEDEKILWDIDTLADYEKLINWV